ncbi:hypothetical protein Glove_173g32 [Diversispora epigaea]|uniref:Uncharacterized protein n=1 Tax=Diversispora epigaea TaxID=1348612 RepID=A0A397ISK8_9GLOM|nr:hypothetical protein Glove_173g32 [Diversispora epigaea]
MLPYHQSSIKKPRLEECWKGFGTTGVETNSGMDVCAVDLVGGIRKRGGKWQIR